VIGSTCLAPKRPGDVPLRLLALQVCLGHAQSRSLILDAPDVVPVENRVGLVSADLLRHGHRNVRPPAGSNSTSAQVVE
jgi:hypothetical protein